MMKKIALLVISSLVFTACTHTALNPEPVATPLPGDQPRQHTNDDVPIFPTNPKNSDSEDRNSNNTDCGIENCHGLEIECGANVAQVCTQEYVLGDFCRQYAECGVVDGSCQQIENETFVECKSCVEQCLELSDSADQFACEENCRAEITNK